MDRDAEAQWEKVARWAARMPTHPRPSSILGGQAWRELLQRDMDLAAVVSQFVKLGDEASAVKLLLPAAEMLV